MGTYNRERIINVVLESIQAQSYSNWELIIVDDNSTDQTLHIVRTYAAQDQRIILIRNTQRYGPFPPLNRALEHASGEFIAINDSDDVMHPYRLEFQVRFMQHHSWCGATATRYTARNEKGEVLERHLVPFTPLGVLLHVPIFNAIAHSTLMVRRLIMQRLGGYNTEYRYSADWDLILRICSITRLRVIPRQLEILTRSTDNITTTQSELMERYGTTVADNYATTIGLNTQTTYRALFLRVFVWRYYNRMTKLLWYIQTVRYKWHILMVFIKQPPYPNCRVRLIGTYLWSIICTLLT